VRCVDMSAFRAKVALYVCTYFLCLCHMQLFSDRLRSAYPHKVLCPKAEQYVDPPHEDRAADKL